MTGFYTYVHTRADDGKAFYVGKGRGGRATSTRSRNPRWHSTAKKHGVHVDIVARWASESDAFEHEKLLIACFRDMGHPLCNLTDGGDGISGYQHTEKTRAEFFGKPLSAESKAKIGNANRGRVRSADVRARISETLSGRPRDPETKAKISAANKGKVRTAEVRAEIVKALTGRTASAATKAKMSASRSTPERRAQHSAAMAGRPWSEARRTAQKVGRKA